jgi:poly-beta-1,6-N-acetyl-D-glucosamine N-deacetylase PgaB
VKTLIILTFVIFSLLGGTVIEASSETKVYIDGERLNLKIKNGRNLPLELLATAYDYNIYFDKEINSFIINTTDEYYYPQEYLKIPILMYHHFDVNTRNNSTVHPNDFKRQLQYLKNHGYYTINTEELYDFIKNKKKLKGKPLLITIDDGYQSNYDMAYPILKELNMKATIFVIGSRIDEENKQPIKIEKPKFSWTEAKEMYDSGLIDIQNHTFNLHKKANTVLGHKGQITARKYLVNEGRFETIEEYNTRIMNDILVADGLIESMIGNNVTALAYPFGDFSKHSKAVLSQIGYQMAFTVRKGLADRNSDLLELNRINVSGHHTGKDIVYNIHNIYK